MINLDQRYHDYLLGSKKFHIDGNDETVKGYGWSCDGSKIIGYYVLTESYKVHYNLQEVFVKLEVLDKI